MTDPPTDLLLVRHGQAVCNVMGVVGGPRSCTGLTPLGREQARRLAARLNGGEAVTVMYTAPRLRVQETAQIIGRDIRLAPAPDPLLDGPDHGDADGRPWSEVKTDRITRIIQQHQGERVLIVGHAETVEAACTLLLGPGRPRTAPSVRALVLEMAGDNPGWGTKRYAERGPPQRVLFSHAHDQAGDAGVVGGRPGLRRLHVSYFRAVSLRCQASSVAGVTGKTWVLVLSYYHEAAL